jgi:hypothetical protein
MRASSAAQHGAQKAFWGQYQMRHLRMWGADYEELEAVSLNQATTKEQLIQLFIDKGVEKPKSGSGPGSMKAYVQAYCARQAKVEEHAEESASEAASSESTDSDSEDDEAEPVQVARAAQGSRARGPGTAVARAAAGPAADRRCQHCGQAQSTNHASPKCANGHCGLVMALPIDHDVNARILAAQLPSHGRTGHEGECASAAASKAAEPDHQLYTSAAARAHCTITAAEMIRRVRRDSYRGLAFAPAAESVLKGIRAGRFQNMRDWLPVSVESQLSAAALDLHATKVSGIGGAALLLVADEESQHKLQEQAAAKLKRRQVKSFEDFMEAAVCTVIPALWDQPAAMADFVTLTASLIRINQQLGWAAAAAYLQRTLVNGLVEQLPYGKFNQSLFLSVEQEFYHGTRTHSRDAVASRGGGQSFPRRSGDSSSEVNGTSSGGPRLDVASKQDEGCCRMWNFRVDGCLRTRCPLKHQCIWLQCTSRRDGHQGRACLHNPEEKRTVKSLKGPASTALNIKRAGSSARASKELATKPAAEDQDE